MALIFDSDRERFIVQWRSPNGQRKSKTLWSGASPEGAQEYHDNFLRRTTDPFADLRNALERMTIAPPNPGTIYAVSNEALPSLYKIGKTSGPLRTRLAAFNTAHPYDWKVEREIRVTHMSQFERALHDHFFAERVNPAREFFRMDTGLLNEAFDICVEIGDAQIRAKDLHRD